MEFILTIDGKEYGALYTGLTLRIYREQFQEDMFLKAQSVQEEVAKSYFEKSKVKNFNPETFDFGVLVLHTAGEEYMNRIVWTCIKAYAQKNKEKVKNYRDFIDSVEDINNFYLQGIGCHEAMILGNRQTVKSDEEPTEEEKDTKKK